jgi:hypothetical protein
MSTKLVCLSKPSNQDLEEVIDTLANAYKVKKI